MAGMDRTADIFVPQWLQAVNQQRCVVVRQAPLHELNFFEYAATLYPTPLLQHFEREDTERYKRVDHSLGVAIKKTVLLKASAVVIKRPDGTVLPTAPPAALLLQGLSPTPEPATYAHYYLQQLYVEYDARAQQLRSANLYSSRLTPVPYDAADLRLDSGVQHLYTLEAKSIREGWPGIDLGDNVRLRQLRPWAETWQGLEFTSTVHSINRAVGQVTLRIDSLKSNIETLLFNVIWQPQDRIFYASRKALEAAQFLMTPILSAEAAEAAKAPPVRSRMEKWLFPLEQDLIEMSAPTESLVWYDDTLNEEQRHAVMAIVFGQKSATNPLLIHGPPGTGKTKTLVEAALQLLLRFPATTVLIVGASNPSADTLASRLVQHQHISPKQLFRLNDPSRPFTEIRSQLLPFCFIEQERFALPPLADLLSKRIIVASCADCALLSAARLDNVHLARAEHNVMSVIHPHDAKLPQPHFGYLLVDEAAQSMEPEILIALAVAVTDEKYSEPSILALAGDAKQLGPNIVAPECIGLDTSLLDRLSARSVYKDHPSARKNQIVAGGPGGEGSPEWKLGIPFVALVRNYRSATPILGVPSTLFYAESLVPSASVAKIQNSPLHSYARLANKFPLLFINVKGADEAVDEGASYFNMQEVLMITHLVAELTSPAGHAQHGALRPEEISVITPYREQVWRIRLALRAINQGGVDVGNVEALQGAENRVVIISTVRSLSHKDLVADRAKHRGLMFEPRRFNVALTRAKEVLIVVGNAEMLSLDPNWRTFLNFCTRNGGFSGSPPAALTERDGPELISRLEVAWRAARSGGKEDNLDHDFDVLVGSVARESMWEADEA